MATMNGTLLEGAEKDLLRIGRELAVIHAQLSAAKAMAQGAWRRDEDDEWFSPAEHVAPLNLAIDQLRTARTAVLQTVREVQGTNPIPSKPCTDPQHDGEPRWDDDFCTVCAGSGYVPGLDRQTV